MHYMYPSRLLLTYFSSPTKSVLFPSLICLFALVVPQRGSGQLLREPEAREPGGPQRPEPPGAREPGGHRAAAVRHPRPPDPR